LVSAWALTDLPSLSPFPLGRYNAFGADGAFFVSQGINALYVVYGGAVLYPRMLCTDHVTPEMRRLPKVQ
jgi:hypothetical protein